MKLAILFILLMQTSSVFAKFKPLNDEELNQISLEISIESYINQELSQLQETSANIDHQMILDRLSHISQNFGITFGEVIIKGVNYGGFQIFLDNSSVEFPSHIERIEINDVKIGSHAPMGALIITDIIIQGSAILTIQH
ncbi:MAG: hypothetical protein QF441_08565 [Bacteriovoracaceae bacterium]|jgi:hypothetical protein|nr:hypothetical protein [Halobacteriovoraceae bacterium]MDP7320647.1 hypothetical protein [Bacteriovoracaceae bacterium]